MPNLTDIANIEELLRTVTPGMRVGDEEPDPPNNDYDLSRSSIDNWRGRQEAIIVSRLSRFYATPLALTSTTTISLLKEIATKLSAYAVWLALHPLRTRDQLPASIELWKKEADMTLDQIVPLGKDQPVDGRDIILEGESLRAGAGDIGTAEVSFTTLLPFGGTRE